MDVEFERLKMKELRGNQRARLLVMAFLAISALTAQAQVFQISDADATTCAGLFVDDGDIADPAGGPYSNANYVITICPETVGDAIAAEFISFQLQTNANPNNNDVLFIYDGNSTAAPLIGAGTGNNFQDVTATASLNNPSGCLTFEFFCLNGATGGAIGWAAELSCVTPCTTPISSFDLIDPEAFQDNPQSVGVCPDQEVTFNGAASTGDGVPLNNWIWNWGDGDISLSSVPEATHSYEEPGEYLVSLVVEDENGCGSTNLEPFQVLVSTLPIFNTATESPICVNQPTFLDGSGYQSVTWTALPPISVSEEQPLPDNSNVPFDSEMTIDFFDEGQLVESCEDILGISAVMEHTFIGDLTIWVECPNGQEMLLLDNGPSGQEDATGCMYPDLGGNNLGDPVAGIGWEYTWSMDADFIMDDPSNPAVAGGATVPAGDYLPCGDMCDLVGCPLNGVWTFYVHDQWLGDDGFLFNWSMDFDPEIVPGVTTFTPTIGVESDSSYWDLTPGDYGFVGLDAPGDYADMVFDQAGSYDFNYVVQNNFGCQWDTTVTIEVLDPPNISAGEDFFACGDFQLGAGLVDADPAVCSEDAGAYEYCYDNGENFTWTFCPDSPGDGSTFMTLSFQQGTVENFFDPLIIYDGEDTNAPVLAGPISGDLTGQTFTATNASGCLTVSFSSDGSVSCASTPTYNSWQYTVGCTNASGIDWSWTPAADLIGADTPSPLSSSLDQTTVYTVTGGWSFLPACSTTDEVEVSPSFDISVESTDPTCFGNDGSLLVEIVTAGSVGPWTIEVFNGANLVGSSFASNPSSVAVEGLAPGNLLVQVSDDNCVIEANVALASIPTPVLTASNDTTICIDGTATLQAVLAPVVPNAVYTWNAAGAAGGTLTVGPNSPSVYTVYATYAEGCQTPTEEVFVDIYDPINLQMTANELICDVDSAWVGVTALEGGLPPYNFAWTPNGAADGFWSFTDVTTTYCVVVTDACETPAIEGCAEVAVPDAIDPTFTVDTLGGCHPVTVGFTSNATNVDQIATSLWSFGDGGQSSAVEAAYHTYIEPGIWSIGHVITSIHGCVYTDQQSALIETYDWPVAAFANDPTVTALPLTHFTFENYSLGANTAFWDFAGFGTSNEWSTTFDFPADQSGEYTVTLMVENAWGCTDVLSRNLLVNESFSMYIPNGFTPDMDGLNDAWKFYGIDVDESDFHVVVFDRWGQKVYESTDLYGAWVGDNLGGDYFVQNGVYTYLITTRSLATKERKVLKGTVTITR